MGWDLGWLGRGAVVGVGFRARAMVGFGSGSGSGRGRVCLAGGTEQAMFSAQEPPKQSSGLEPA